jgi:hypothetical protein
MIVGDELGRVWKEVVVSNFRWSHTIPCRSWLRRYATSRKVAGSIPDEVIEFFFNLPNSYSRNMALWSTQPLTEMSTRNIAGM